MCFISEYYVSIITLHYFLEREAICCKFDMSQIFCTLDAGKDQRYSRCQEKINSFVHLVVAYLL